MVNCSRQQLCCCSNSLLSHILKSIVKIFVPKTALLCFGCRWHHSIKCCGGDSCHFHHACGGSLLLIFDLLCVRPTSGAHVLHKLLLDHEMYTFLFHCRLWGWQFHLHFIWKLYDERAWMLTLSDCPYSVLTRKPIKIRLFETRLLRCSSSRPSIETNWCSGHVNGILCGMPLMAAIPWRYRDRIAVQYGILISSEMVSSHMLTVYACLPGYRWTPGRKLSSCQRGTYSRLPTAWMPLQSTIAVYHTQFIMWEFRLTSSKFRIELAHFVSIVVKEDLQHIRRVKYYQSSEYHRCYASRLRKQVKHYFTEIWPRAQAMVTAADVYQELPAPLKAEVAWFLLQDVIIKSEVLQQLSPAAKHQLAGRMVPRFIITGHDICRQGDLADKLWILQEGAFPWL